MKKWQFIVVALVFVLVGCQHFASPLGSAMPRVSVVDGRINVVPEVLLFFPDQRDVAITWHLPPDSKLRFPENGIVIEGKVTEQLVRGRQNSVLLEKDQNEIMRCRSEKEGREFTCLNRHTTPGIYKYTIRLQDGSKVLERDPYVMNM